MLAACTVPHNAPTTYPSLAVIPCLAALSFGLQRYTWHTAQKRYSPEHVPVWCSCELPENPDLAMAECDRCLNWYHFACEGESAEAVAQGGAYICRRCRRAMSNGVLVEPSAAGYIAGPPRP